MECSKHISKRHMCSGKCPHFKKRKILNKQLNIILQETTKIRTKPKILRKEIIKIRRETDEIENKNNRKDQ